MSNQESRKHTRRNSLFGIPMLRKTSRESSTGRSATAMSKGGSLAPHCTAIVTVLEATPPMLRITGTASPEGAPAGTWTFTW